MNMAISKTSYKDLKEYWDYQRLLEYNREVLEKRLSRVETSIVSHYGTIDVNEMFDKVWSKMTSDDYEKPIKGWIPKDEKYRFEWEGKPDPTTLDKVKMI